MRAGELDQSWAVRYKYIENSTKNTLNITFGYLLDIKRLSMNTVSKVEVEFLLRVEASHQTCILNA